MALLKRTPAAVVLFSAAFLLVASGTGRAEVASEYDVKAAFLYNFTKFVEWPSSAFTSESSMQLCVLGQDPFGKSLMAFGGEAVAGRRLQLVRAREIPKLDGCQILFISRSERHRMLEVLRELRNTPVLTVADTDGFLDQGGIINFRLVGSKVRFEINQEAAERAGIKISSKLLQLAVHVKGSPGP